MHLDCASSVSEVSSIGKLIVTLRVWSSASCISDPLPNCFKVADVADLAVQSMVVLNKGIATVAVGVQCIVSACIKTVRRISVPELGLCHVGVASLLRPERNIVFRAHVLVMNAAVVVRSNTA